MKPRHNWADSGTVCADLAAEVRLFAETIEAAPEQELRPSTGPEWGAREILIHLVFWHGQYVSVIRALLEDREPALLKGSFKSLNAQCIEQFSDCTTAELLADLDGSQRALDGFAQLRKARDIGFSFREGSREWAFSEFAEAVAGHFRRHRLQLQRAPMSPGYVSTMHATPADMAAEVHLFVEAVRRAPAEALQPSDTPQWGAREILCHLVFWHAQYVSIIRALVVKRRPDLLNGSFTVFNHESVRLYTDWTIGELLASLRRSQRALDRLAQNKNISDITISVRQGSKKESFAGFLDDVTHHFHTHRMQVERLARRKVRARQSSQNP